MPFAVLTAEEQALQEFLFPFKAPLPVDPDTVMREKDNPTFEIIPPKTPGGELRARIGPSAINPFVFFDERAGPRDRGQFPAETLPPAQPEDILSSPPPEFLKLLMEVSGFTEGFSVDSSSPENRMRERAPFPDFEGVFDPSTGERLYSEEETQPGKINPFVMFNENAGPVARGGPSEERPATPFPDVPPQLSSSNPFIDFLLQLFAPDPGRQMAEEVSFLRMGQEI